MGKYYILSEDLVKDAAKEVAGSNNAFDFVLAAGAEFANAGMTPFYVVNETMTEIRCFAQETYNKKLH